MKEHNKDNEDAKNSENKVVSEHDDFIDEPEEHGESYDDMKSKEARGDKEEDVYTEEGRDNLVENDELDPWEEGYVEGAEATGEKKRELKKGKLAERESLSR